MRFTVVKKMASKRKIAIKAVEFFLHKYPIVNALTLLMLFAERAANESAPPINHRIIYANLIGFLGCALLMSSNIQRKAAALFFCGQLGYFTYVFYSNKKLNYKEWLRLQVCTRQVGCIGIYLLFAYVIDRRKSVPLRRFAEIIMGLYLFAFTYLINNVHEVRSGVLSHMIGGEWGRYVVTVLIAACALSFFSGYFLRDMSLCAAVVIAFMVCTVDSDVDYWSRKGVHYWNQIRMIADSLCVCVGLIYAFFHLENRVKMD
ncbi:transmembrane protein 101-like [Physella acuta]|uniref:transmembrane protein 101-like n=1 Tax=Physella acuta TaxID=109671 RepID=UPI0027DE7750|nr:transmembrane protein 101-like [Physella acuta]